jgi:catechol 1,2-dioxygenase
MNMPNPTQTSIERTRIVVEDLERVLIDFMRKHQITHDEYRRATDLLVNTVKAGEESLLFDVFFEAEATDIGNASRNGSPEGIEGPFYLPGAPKLTPPHALPQRLEEAGNVLMFRGSVSDTDGHPIPHAQLDLWHADAQGLYSNIHPDIPDWNLRGRFDTDANGVFEVRTILPPPYEIPKHGPTGMLLSALGRHFFRPAHLHVKVRHPDYEELTSQLYFEGGEYIDDDVANAVRNGLVVNLDCNDGGTGPGLPRYEMRYDFRLQAKA